MMRRTGLVSHALTPRTGNTFDHTLSPPKVMTSPSLVKGRICGGGDLRYPSVADWTAAAGGHSFVRGTLLLLEMSLWADIRCCQKRHRVLPGQPARLWRTANAAAAARFSRSAFVRIWVTWLVTVFPEMHSRLQISRFVIPAASNLRTSTSLPVKLSGYGGLLASSGSSINADNRLASPSKPIERTR